MAAERIDPSEQIPEADLLEQQIPLDPPLTDHEQHWGGRETAVDPIDAADRWEQQLPVPAADDDYPHDRFELG